MKLEGIHHVTAITADAQRNVDFYAGLLGLRLVKKSVNQDHTSVYHLFYADETGGAGSDITFFEYPGAPIGRAGAGMIHRVVWRLATAEALDFWQQRLANAGYDAAKGDNSLIFSDFEGLEHELQVVEDNRRAADRQPPRDSGRARAAGLPRRARLRDRSRPQPPAAGADAELRAPARWQLRGPRRAPQRLLRLRPRPRRAPAARRRHGAPCRMGLADRRARGVAAARRHLRPAHPTPIIDRHYFRSIYFREPSGVLFEIATLGPGFTVDEPLEHLGEKLSLTPQFEHLRDQIEPTLTPLRNPRELWAGRPASG